MPRRLAGMAAVVATLAIAGAIAERVTNGVDTLGLERACAEVIAGDSVADVFDILGLPGYQPGCTTERPCVTADFGSHAAVPYVCDGEDCSLYWRAGDLGCLVEWTRGAPGVTGAELLHLPR